MDCQKSMYGHIGRTNKEWLILNFAYNNEAYQAIIPKYKYWLEGNREIYLSSAFYQNHWSYEKVLSFSKNMIDDHRGEKNFLNSRYRRSNLDKEFHISWDDREDMICSCEIDEIEVEKLI